MSIMRLALVELNIAWEDKANNLIIAEKCCEKAAEFGVELICFPEMSFTGFSMNTELTKQLSWDNSRINADKGLAVAFGWVKDCGELCENHYSIIKDNECILDYAKIHPFSYSGEDKYFRGGNELKLCNMADFNVGVNICYDLRFADTFACMADMAELVLVPANWPASRANHWKTLLAARAIENQVYVAGVNCYGSIGGLGYSGDSALYNPNGDIIKPAHSIDMGRGKMYIYDIENDVADYRKSFPVRQDRRTLG